LVIVLSIVVENDKKKMLSSLEKHWSIISIALLVLLLTSLWLWPERQSLLSLAIIIVSVGMLLVFTVHRRVDENRKGLIDRSTMKHLIILDCVGIFLVLALAMYVGSYVSKLVGTAVFNALQASNPRWAGAVAIISSLLAALAAGVGVGWLVRSVWVRVERLIIGRKSGPSLA
jgi:hypothetical protein